jgi:predicted N-formylglutamate amidohydrolase
MRADAFELYGADQARFPVVITCEHASARIPRPLRVNAQDRPFLRTHWALDIGAATISRELARQTDSVAILSRFSRLVCDANRPISDPTWIRETVEGHRLGFNRGITPAEQERRQQAYFRPYHDAIDRMLGQRLVLGGEVVLLAVHTFTPVLGTDTREMELGVLFNDHEPVARRLAEAFQHEGFTTALNEPYSGLDGMMFAAERHGRTHDVVHLELEVRQDLVDTAPRARAVGRRIAGALSHLGIRRKVRG